MKLRLLPVVWALVAVVALSGCSGSSAYMVSDATRTPLPAAVTPTSPLPTSTAAPTVVDPGGLSETYQARQYLSAGRYEEAVSLLNGLYGRFRDDQTVRDLLAGAYLDWGKALVATGAGDVKAVSAGLEKFVSGLAVAPDDGAVAGDLTAQQEQARGYLSLVQELDRLTGVISGTAEITAEARGELDTMASLAGRLYDHDPAYPGLKPLYVRALLLAGEAYGRSKGANNAESLKLAERSLELCTAVLDADPNSGAAKTCASKAEKAIKKYQDAERPGPTGTDPCAPQRCLRFKTLNYNDEPHCISVRVTGINTAGWSLTIDGLKLRATFGGGDARVCGLSERQEVTLTVRDAGGNPVRGGSGIPSRGTAIMLAEWR